MKGRTQCPLNIGRKLLPQEFLFAVKKVVSSVNFISKDETNIYLNQLLNEWKQREKWN